MIKTRDFIFTSSDYLTKGVIGIKLNVADSPASRHLMSESCQPQYNSCLHFAAGAGDRVTESGASGGEDPH